MARALMTDRQKNVAELMAAGLTRQQIAHRLTVIEAKPVSPAAVKQRLNRARKRTRDRYAALVSNRPLVALTV